MEDLVPTLIRDWMSRPPYGPGSEREPESQHDLHSRLAERGLEFQAFADSFAREIAQRFVTGKVSFDEGCNAMGWLHHCSLMPPQGVLLDGLAWQVYSAFDAADGGEGANAADGSSDRYTLSQIRQLLSSAAA